MYFKSALSFVLYLRIMMETTACLVVMNIIPRRALSAMTLLCLSGAGAANESIGRCVDG
jgi:hypothetical protein